MDCLSGLLGLDEKTTTYLLLKMMGVLKDRGESLQFDHTVFQDALTMVGTEVEVERSSVGTSMST